MSRSRYVRWSDSAVLFVLKARDRGMTTKQIAQEVARSEPAVIELLRRFDEGAPTCPHCGKPLGEAP